MSDLIRFGAMSSLETFRHFSDIPVGFTPIHVATPKMHTCLEWKEHDVVYSNSPIDTVSWLSPSEPIPNVILQNSWKGPTRQVKCEM
jgi:hypothetical protein